jgi:glycine/D-amino acid oxidase-like deaminating enzyme/nitrite reductase/ring-hydroxylating ferredoxin subunit
MNAIEEKSLSLWMDTAEVRQAPALARDEHADVVVVGSGIAGLSTAYELAKLGQSVIVLDRGELAGGMSSRTSAHLTSALDDLYSALIGMRGEAEARQYYQTQQAAIERIDEIRRGEKIACDFHWLDGYLFPAREEDIKTLEDEIKACHRIGFGGVDWADSAPTPGKKTGRTLRFSNQARFHPRKYLDGLIRCIKRDGGRLFAQTPVVEVKEQKGQVLLKTARGNVVTAGAALIATNSPINDWIAIHTKQAPYRTYAFAGRVPKKSIPDALYWDTEDPYHYVRLQPGDEESDWLIVGGEDHKTGQADDAKERFKRLKAWARPFFPSLKKIELQWSGQVLDPVDYLPYSGLNPGNKAVFVHTGDSGQGLTNGVAGSLLLRDLILGRDNPAAKIFAPGRKSPKAAGRYISENASVAANLAEYVTGGEISSVGELKRGQGAILRQGMKKVAAYRDHQGKVHLHSAACTHAGCIIHWNSFESCWDCTCHGSHFSPDGQPLNAPAFMPLAEVEPGPPAKRRAKSRSAPVP